LRLLYSALLTLSALAALPVLLFKSFRDRDLLRHLGERLGGITPFNAGAPPPLWVQAVSVGEVQVARRLLEELRPAAEEVPVLLTSTTSAGRRLAGLQLPVGSRAGFFPLDLPPVAERSMRRIHPRALILVETEIWPNLIQECSRRRVPVILANGRISDRSFPRYRMVRSLIAPALRSVDLLCMQSEEDAERIRNLGAPPERIKITGNIKWDFPEIQASPGDVRRELGLPEEAPLLVAGSTGEGEEEIVLRAWQEARERFPELRLVLAPRHPPRFERVARLLGDRKIPFERRSRGGAAGFPVLLLDTVGELRRSYVAGTVCFVGGSLTSRGGQNMMEPAAAGRPVLFGPRTENFREAARLLLEAGAAFRVADAPALSAAVTRLLQDPGECRRAGERGRRLVAANRGAALRTAQAISGILQG
jgi:3-deoxy-D-manno-octulosonic-acid transferase